MRDSEHGIIHSSNTRCKNIVDFLQEFWPFSSSWCSNFCLVLVFSTLIPEKSKKSERAKKNYTHMHMCTQTLTIGQSINKYFLSHLLHAVGSTYASYSRIGQELRPPPRVHGSPLFIFLVSQESYLLANTVFCLSLHKHLEVINNAFHSQLVRATKYLWTSCSSAVIFHQGGHTHAVARTPYGLQWSH